MTRARNKLVVAIACVAIVTGCDRMESTLAGPEAGPENTPQNALTNGGGAQALSIAKVTSSARRANKAPEKTLDGNLGTRWQAWGDGQWLQFDLGSTRRVETVEIAWYRGVGRIASFDIETSANGKSWESVFSGESSGQTLALESYDAPDGEARYVRIVGHGTNVSSENLIAEVEILGDRRRKQSSQASNTDVSVAKVAKVTASAHRADKGPGKALDGDLDTRWQAWGDGQWLQFDLGTVREVTGIDIAWLEGDNRVASFDVETSRDAQSWASVFSGKSSGETAALEFYDITDGDARYVRIIGHGTTRSPENLIAEVEIRAGDATGEDPPPGNDPNPPPGNDNPPPPPSGSGGTLFSDDFDSYPLNSRPQGTFANGFRWAPGSAGVTVSDDHAYSGSKSLRFAYPGKPDPAKMSSQEKRFVIAPEGTTSIDEIWVEFMIRVPDNWEHRDSESSDNNKLLALWAEDYHNSRGEALVVFEWGRGSNSMSSLDLASGAGDDPRAIRQLQGRAGVRKAVFDASMRGQWIRLRFYVKISTLGIIRSWRNNELIADLPFPFNTAIFGGPNYIRNGYLMGWSNSGFTRDTDFYIDDFKIWTTDPNWTL